MKYAFFGTSDFAVMILGSLLDAHIPPAVVVTNPDRPAGRKKTLTPPPLKPVALAAGIPVLQPEKLDESFINALRQEQYDFFLLASYGKILPASLLAASRLGTVGVHVSLLPYYRGASPMQSAILGGESETGVTLYLMDEKVDHGPILARKSIPLARQTFLELQKESAEKAGMLLADVLPKFVQGGIEPEVQDHTKATFTGKFTGENAFIEFTELERALRGEDAVAGMKIERMIRALTPEPGVWTLAPTGKRVKLLEAHMDGNRLVLRRIQKEGGLPADWNGVF